MKIDITVLHTGHKRAASAQFESKLLMIHDLKAFQLGFLFLLLFLFLLPLDIIPAKADLKSISNPNLSASSAPTLPQCDAATTSALLLGWWPTNPFTP